jgi:hypothetical protein
MADKQQNFLYDVVLPRVEQVSLPVAVLGLALKYLLLPAGDVVLMVGISTLAVVYFLQVYSPNSNTFTTAPIEETGNSFEYTGAAEPPPFLAVVADKVVGQGMAVTLIGLLFSLLFWKGGRNLLVVGSGSLVLALILLANVGQFSRKGFVIAVLGIGMLLTPAEALVRIFYRDDPALVKKMIYQQQHPGDKAAAAEVQRLLQARHNR